MSFPGSSKRLCLITGGANGIGLATAKNLAEKNYELILIDKDASNLEIGRAHV